MNTHRGQRVGYARVSTTDQNLDRQIDELGDLDRLFTDQASGSRRSGRDGLADLLNYVRDGDEVVVVSMDRLARSLEDLLATVHEINAAGASVEFLHEAQTYRPGGSDPMSALLLGVLGSVAEFERALIRERQAEGIAAARRRGTYARRRPRLTQATVDEVRRQVHDGIPKAEVARRFDLSRPAVYRILDGTYQANA